MSLTKDELVLIEATYEALGDLGHEPALLGRLCDFGSEDKQELLDTIKRYRNRLDDHGTTRKME